MSIVTKMERTQAEKIVIPILDIHGRNFEGKIAAIKALRKEFGWSLVESNMVVEDIMSSNSESGNSAFILDRYRRLLDKYNEVKRNYVQLRNELIDLRIQLRDNAVKNPSLLDQLQIKPNPKMK